MAKRCPNGTRKNAKTGQCEKAKANPANKQTPTKTAKKMTMTIKTCGPSANTAFFKQMFGEPIDKSEMTRRAKKINKYVNSHTNLNYSIQICKNAQDMYSHMIVFLGRVKVEYYNNDSVKDFSDRVQDQIGKMANMK
jgi:hypothetical protein